MADGSAISCGSNSYFDSRTGNGVECARFDIATGANSWGMQFVGSNAKMHTTRLEHADNLK